MFLLNLILEISIKSLDVHNFINFAWKLNIFSHVISFNLTIQKFWFVIFGLVVLLPCVYEWTLTLTYQIFCRNLMVNHFLSNITDLFICVITIIIILGLNIHTLSLGIYGLFNYLFLDVHRISSFIYQIFFGFFIIKIRQFNFFIFETIVNGYVCNIFFLENHHGRLAANWW